MYKFYYKNYPLSSSLLFLTPYVLLFENKIFINHFIKLLMRGCIYSRTISIIIFT